MVLDGSLPVAVDRGGGGETAAVLHQSLEDLVSDLGWEVVPRCLFEGHLGGPMTSGNDH